jgi:nicotinamide riboside transporter PnuC
MAFAAFTRLLCIASLCGVVLNIRKRHECFAVWAVTNACWAAVDVAHGVWAQAALQAVYFGLAIWGMVEWRRK